MQIDHLRKAILRQILIHANTADIVAEHPQLLRLLSIQWHILLSALPR